jgi:hypothetical protein
MNLRKDYMHSGTHNTPVQNSANSALYLVLVANCFVAGSSTPSLYIKYRSVRASSAPCNLLTCVSRSCVQAVFMLGDTYGKVRALYALSTAPARSLKTWLCFVHKLSTVFAHKLLSYAQKQFQLSTTMLVPGYAPFPQDL